MAIRKFTAILFPLLSLCLILVVSTAVIAYGRGYRPNFGGKTPSLSSTGLLSVSSDPTAAQVFIDGDLRSATTDSFNIDPGWYTIKIAKDGYISWEKKLRVQGEVVTRADAFLFPTSPSLSPITTNGVQHPVLSPDGTKIAYTIPIPEEGQQNGSAKNAGLWIYDLADRPLGLNRDHRQIAVTSPTFDFSKAALRWSPDSTQLLVQIGDVSRLYQTSRNSEFLNVSTTFPELLAEWETEKRERELQKLSSFKQPIIDIASSSAKIVAFSPDESKLLYEATASATIPLVIDPPLIGTNSTGEERNIKPGRFYVYDSREDKNYFLLDRSELPAFKVLTPTPTPRGRRPSPTVSPPPILSEPQPIHWFPTNRHLVLTLEGKIDILEYDRTNWITVYSGPFIDGFMAPWPNGSRIIIMTNFNQGVFKLPNLYTVNLR